MRVFPQHLTVCVPQDLEAPLELRARPRGQERHAVQFPHLHHDAWQPLRGQEAETQANVQVHLHHLWHRLVQLPAQHVRFLDLHHELPDAAHDAFRVVPDDVTPHQLGLPLRRGPHHVHSAHGAGHRVLQHFLAHVLEARLREALARAALAAHGAAGTAHDQAEAEGPAEDDAVSVPHVHVEARGQRAAVDEQPALGLLAHLLHSDRPAIPLGRIPDLAEPRWDTKAGQHDAVRSDAVYAGAPHRGHLRLRPEEVEQAA
mmetsp:Transcript_104522/g.294530  ORF Transcript_104522/g.294530 Transcript_104522/m.294530 type:complete len:259 (-) Transcript_104522:1461-2237(-)